MSRAAVVAVVRPVMPRATVAFKSAPLVLAHGRGRAALEWAGVLAFTLLMVAVTAWALATPAGVEQ